MNRMAAIGMGGLLTLCAGTALAFGPTKKVASCSANSCSVAENAGNVTLASMSSDKDIVETAVAAGSFKTLAAALKAADLVGALQGDGPFTVFAPTDAAFAKLPAGTVDMLVKPENKELLTSILTYHVVPGEAMAGDVVQRNTWTTLNGQTIEVSRRGGNVMIDGAKVTSVDITCSNGVIHVIDSVIMPSTKNIVETASEAGSFGTLLAAAKAAGLADALSGDGPYTVFAPTDEAFEKLPAGTVQSLLKPENKDKLAAILKYHVVPGRVLASDAVAAQTAETLQGGAVRIRIQEGRLTVDGANVISSDIEASNGVVHVIDSVILPG
jgi:uncharacterized surface protein with fasciclin (FAS1) repeats